MIIHGDCLHQLRLLEDNSVDLIVTDPPYGYSFMGKDWDKAVPSVEIWKECLRVLKHGGFAFIMSAPRSDVLSRMIVRVEDAGFRVDFSPIYWTYASGFPKAMNIGKMVDKRLGAEREVLGKRHTATYDGCVRQAGVKFNGNDYNGGKVGMTNEVDITAPATPQAKALDGSYGGFQPKPAVEVVIVAMKPLSEKTYVDQALTNGKGVTWLDDCRVPIREQMSSVAYGQRKATSGFEAFSNDGTEYGDVPTGRFPANLLVEDDILGDYSRFFSLDKWAENLPFLAVPKASKREKNEGLDGFEKSSVKITQGHGRGAINTSKGDGAGLRTIEPSANNHPTVKPLTLMSYLITLGSREGDTVLDPFLGSGTTAIAAEKLNRKAIGIEREEEYVDIARARVEQLRRVA